MSNELIKEFEGKIEDLDKKFGVRDRGIAIFKVMDSGSNLAKKMWENEACMKTFKNLFNESFKKCLWIRIHTIKGIENEVKIKQLIEYCVLGFNTERNDEVSPRQIIERWINNNKIVDCRVKNEIENVLNAWIEENNFKKCLNQEVFKMTIKNGR